MTGSAKPIAVTSGMMGFTSFNPSYKIPARQHLICPASEAQNAHARHAQFTCRANQSPHGKTCPALFQKIFFFRFSE